MPPPLSAESPRRASAAALYALALILVLGALAGAFLSGLLVGRDGIDHAADRTRAIEQERELLSQELAELRQQGIALERAQQIDEEAARALRDQLKESQGQRLVLEKEVALLRRLIQEGGKGIPQVKELSLEQPSADEVLYRFTVSQLIPEFGRSEGTVELRVRGSLAGEERTLGLPELESAEPGEHRMGFQHFQVFEGRLRLPSGLVAERLIIDVKPKTKGLLPVTETFPWPPSP